MYKGGSFILLVCPNTQRLLFGLRSKEAQYSPNTWCPFGGTIEPNEHPLNTAKREFSEETKLSPEVYTIYPDKCHMINKYDDNGDLHHIFIYLATCDSEHVPTINSESQQYKWLNLQDLLNISNLHEFVVSMMLNDNTRKNIRKALLIR